MSEGGDYSPGAWSGHDFSEERKKYDESAGRSYENAQAQGKTLADLCPPTLSTKASFVLVINTDGTGSFGEWPATLFSKFPYLDHEIRTEYGAEDAEISFSVTGDARNGEDYPLQARPFAKGPQDLKTRLGEIVLEKKGGGGCHETYELAALYYARNCAMPKAKRKPIYILIADEMPYDSITPALAKRYAHVALQEDISTAEVFEELKKKFSVYLVQKSYPGMTDRVRSVWASLIGDDHIAFLDDPNRVVDVIFGILAKEAERVDYFYQELTGRQRPDQVATVTKALTTIHTATLGGGGGRPKRDGKSVVRLKRG